MVNGLVLMQQGIEQTFVWVWHTIHCSIFSLDTGPSDCILVAYNSHRVTSKEKIKGEDKVGKVGVLPESRTLRTRTRAPLVSGRKRNASSRAYHAIKEEILAFRLRPLDPLRENDLAVQLGMSRTPIREAISKLEREGLVWSEPYRGTFVSPVSLEDILEIYLLREALEGAAARLAALRVDPAAVDALLVRIRTELDVLSPNAQTIADVDTSVHDYVLNTAHQRRFSAIVNQLNEEAVRMKYLGIVVRPRDTRDELIAILEALKLEDPDRAEEAMRAHIRSAREALAQTLSRTEARE